MFSFFFNFLSTVDQFFWSYFAFVLIMVLGGYLTIKMRFFQIRALPSLCKTFVHFLRTRSVDEKGVHPLKVFFASVGGMIGIGNVVGIVTAVQVGGPGALFWVWIAALIGALIKYSEIILGFKYRVANERGGYDGGPIYFLQAAFKSRLVPTIVAILLCIYGVEIYQFSVVSQSLVSNWNFHPHLVLILLLGFVIFAGVGGVKRIGKICSCVMPFFLIAYIFMGLWIICSAIDQLPAIFSTVVHSAFKGHAALGGFAGSSALLAIQHGISRACYSADLGIGYDSMIQSESSTSYPEKQASLAVLGVFLDNLICTMSILIVLVSGIWTANPPIDASELIKSVLSVHFPSMKLFMPLFLLVVGYTTLIAYFCVGMKCARFLSPTCGEKIYIAYAICSFIFFSFFDQTQALLVMSLSGALLLCVNLFGIFRLRRHILPSVAPALPSESTSN
ncbi:MAG TPA: amino acid carrier protein [Rhabdochlamydiaceae bacterium]|jgi:AGCS family alanine or glycine:cation symporter